MSKENPLLSKSLNLAKSKSEWRYIAIFEGILITALVVALIYMFTSVPVRLVPQENPNKTYLTKSGSSDMEYLRIISESDLNNFTDWQPYTIESQWKKLIGRLSSSSYGEFRAALLKFEDEKESQISQTFYESETPPRVYGTNVVYEGKLVRKVGSEEVFNGKMFYVIYYTYESGIPGIDLIEWFDSKKEAKSAAQR